MIIKFNGIIAVLYSVLLCVSTLSSGMLFAADDYMVIRLDEFEEKADSSPVEAAAGVKDNVDIAGNEKGVQLYPLGKPLQVQKSYLVSNVDRIDAINRSVSGITDRYVPEFFSSFRDSRSTAERIKRFNMGYYHPINNEWSWGLRFSGGLYDLLRTEEQEPDSSNLFMLDLVSIYKPSAEWRLYNALVIGGTHDVVSLGARSRTEYNNRGGISASLSGELWVPWAENTVAAKQNGRSSGMRADVTLPLTNNLSLALNSGINWRVATDGMYATSQFLGTEISGGGRMNWTFFQREYRQLPVEFLGSEYFGYETAVSGFGMFASLQAAKYIGGDAENDEDYLIPVTREQWDHRLGLSGSYAFNAHFAAQGELYVGYDPVRKIDFGKLYGFDSRIIYIPTARLRFYGEFALDSEAATGIAEGQTWYYGAGFNCKF